MKLGVGKHQSFYPESLPFMVVIFCTNARFHLLWLANAGREVCCIELQSFPEQSFPDILKFFSPKRSRKLVRTLSWP